MTFWMSVMCCQRLKFWNTMPSRLRIRSIWRRLAASGRHGRPDHLDIFAIDANDAAGGIFEEVDAAQEGRLAGTTAADKRNDIAVLRGHGNALEHFERPEALVQVPDVYGFSLFGRAGWRGSVETAATSVAIIPGFHSVVVVHVRS